MAAVDSALKDVMRPVTLRAFACFALELVGFWACGSVTTAYLGDNGPFWINVLNVVCFLIITLVAVRRPALFRNPLVSTGVLVLAPLSVLLYALFPFNLPSWIAALGLVPLFFASGWMGVMASLSFIKVNRNLILFLMVVAYLISHWLQLFVDNLDGFAAMALAAIVPVAIFFLSRPNVESLLGKYTPSTSPIELLAVSPSSLVPFGSKFFVSLVLFGLVYGFAEFGIARESAANLWPLSFLPLVVLVVYVIVCRKTPSSDFLYLAASLTLIASLLFSLGLRQPIPVELASAGSELCDMFFYCFALVLVGSRSRLAVLPILAWGRTASSFGMTLGAVLAMAVPSTHDALPLVTSIVTFFFVGYALAVVRRFDFDAIANKLEPIRVVITPEQSTVKIDVAKVADRFGLTQREAEIFALLARGRNRKFIEEELTVSPNTVKAHIRNIYGKLDVHSQQELIDVAERYSSTE